MAFPFLPAPKDECLEFAVATEKEARAEYEAAKAAKLRFKQSPPAYFNQFQFNLACQQADEDINILSAKLNNAEQKLAWEKNKKNKH